MAAMLFPDAHDSLDRLKELGIHGYAFLAQIEIEG
jgi:hypothetical protein